MRVATILTALTAIALFDVIFARRHTPAWKRENDHHHRRHSAYGHDGATLSHGIDHGRTYDHQSAVQNNIDSREFEIQRRVKNGRFSFYETGLGACGAVNSGNEFIVALNAAQFDLGGYCFKKITITINGKTTQATITDRCPGCPYGGLDFSRGLFNFFAAEDVGIIYGDWNIEGASHSPPSPSPPRSKVEVKVEASLLLSSPPPPPATPSISATSKIATSSSTTLSSTTSSSTAPSSSASVATSTVNTPASDKAPLPTYKPEDHKGCVENLDLALVHLGAMIASGSQPGQVVNLSPSLVASSGSALTASR